MYMIQLYVYIMSYHDLSEEKESKINPKYDPTNLELDEYDYSKWHKKMS